MIEPMIIILLIVLFFSFLFYVIYTRNKIIKMNMRYMKLIEHLINRENIDSYVSNAETLEGKVTNQLVRLYEIMSKQISNNEEEKKKLQSFISDISHQVKTPITNLMLYEAALNKKDLEKEQLYEFVTKMGSQITKLDFLMQALIQISRMETGLITLVKEEDRPSTLIAQALNGVILLADKKQITIHVNCNKDELFYYDKKWTTEALFNLLDNSIKYMKNQGVLEITASKLELFTKIDVKDNGIGIDAQHLSKIFTRFYREPGLHDSEGIGIGLYLSREIISRQGGYIKVVSELGMGSTFSLFLPNQPYSNSPLE